MELSQLGSAVSLRPWVFMITAQVLSLVYLLALPRVSGLKSVPWNSRAQLWLAFYSL